MQPMMKVFALGGLKILLGDEPVVHLGSRKAAALIVYLIGTGRPQAREVLAELLWDDRSQSQALSNLRGVLTTLRKHFDPYLVLTRETAALNPQAKIWSDVVEFEAGLQAIHEAGGITAVSAADRARRVAELYRGEFLQGFYLRGSQGFDAWMVPERERLHQLALNTLSDLVDYCLQQGDHQSGIAHATRLLELDPLMESAHRQMMHLLALSGKRALAMKQYETLQQMLAQELDIEPEPESLQLYEDIRAGRLSADVPRPVTIIPSETRPSHNLPSSLTPLIGRESDVENVTALLQDSTCRLVTLAGPGGIGKTRLALQTAEVLLPALQHGAWFVALESLDSPEFLPEAFASALNLHLSGQVPPSEQLLESLRHKDLLLVLDNFEQLLPQGTGLLIEILQAAPGVKLLVTSRERLNLQAECLYEVTGLDYPKDGPAGAMDAYAAVALFRERARRATGRDLPDEDGQHVVRIARLVEGSPLALELAAAWTRALSPTEIAVEIERGLSFPQVRQPDVPARHRGMRAVFAQSWRLLSDEEKAAFRRLSVFRGGFDREAACKVAGASLDALAGLVDKSLVHHLQGGRYRVHALLRRFAADELGLAGETTDTREGHLAYYLQLAEQAEPQLWTDQEEAWLDRLGNELDNLRKALEWSLSPHSSLGIHSGLTLVASFRELLARRGYLREAGGWLTDILAHPQSVEYPKAFANVLRLAAWLNYFAFGKFEEARGGFERSLAIAEEQEDPLILAHVLSDFGNFCIAIDRNLTVGETFLERSLSLYRQLGYAPGIAIVLRRLGHLSLHQRNKLAAHSYFRESLQVWRASGSISGTAHGLFELGRHSALIGHPAEARELLKESLALYRDLNHHYVEPLLLSELGKIEFNAGEISLATGYFEEMLAVCRNSGEERWTPIALYSLGLVSSSQDDYAKALTYYDEAMSLARKTGDKIVQIGILLAKGISLSRYGDGMQALPLLEDGLLLSRETKSNSYGAVALIGLAGLSAAGKQPQRAARLIGIAERMFDLNPMALTYFPAVYSEYKRIKVLVLEQLDDSTYHGLLEEGSAMAAKGLDHVVEYALDAS